MIPLKKRRKLSVITLASKRGIFHSCGLNAVMVSPHLILPPFVVCWSDCLICRRSLVGVFGKLEEVLSEKSVEHHTLLKTGRYPSGTSVTPLGHWTRSWVQRMGLGKSGWWTFFPSLFSPSFHLPNKQVFDYEMIENSLAVTTAEVPLAKRFLLNL